MSLPEIAALPAVATESGFALAGQPMPEMRSLGPDGWHWPVDRARMRNEAAIEARMADDLFSARNQEGDPSISIMLADAGWRIQQIDTHERPATIRFLAMLAHHEAGGINWWEEPPYVQAGFLSFAVEELAKEEARQSAAECAATTPATDAGKDLSIAAGLAAALALALGLTLWSIAAAPESLADAPLFGIALRGSL